MLASPENPEVANLLEFSKREPFETSLITHLEEAERKLTEFEGRNVHGEMEEGPALQEPEFDEEEVEWSPLKKVMMRPRISHRDQSGVLCQTMKRMNLR
ncbi:hypothetical protein LOAG_18074 [Loa loa]|uniref:Uncharacterized protein n=1 Tax=Loa loa TaxID=7209 RepID=A0A1S0UG10_LOALO|nr:hypothetical protein LOAG_18074 [Loa loa]EJD74630.1 hypothetical protein LOAG_18074 [Loa loa]